MNAVIFHEGFLSLFCCCNKLFLYCLFIRIPSILMIHFVEGLLHNNLRNYSFQFEKDFYEITSVIQYQTNKKHFITWALNPDGKNHKFWYNTLSSTLNSGLLNNLNCPYPITRISLYPKPKLHARILWIPVGTLLVGVKVSLWFNWLVQQGSVLTGRNYLGRVFCFHNFVKVEKYCVSMVYWFSCLCRGSEVLSYEVFWQYEDRLLPEFKKK